MVREVRVESFYAQLGDVALLLIIWGRHRDLRRILHLGVGARIFVIDSHWQNVQVVIVYTMEDDHQAVLADEFDVSELANASDLSSYDEIEEDVDSDEDSESEDGNRKRGMVSSGVDTDAVRLFGKLKSEHYRMGTFHGRPARSAAILKLLPSSVAT